MLIQKFHAALYPGESPAVAATGAKLFSRQGHCDGGSTLHCVAMALALLGRIGDPVWLPYHEEGAERSVWDHAWPHYMHGLTLSELASFIAELNIGVRPVRCTDNAPAILRFSERELAAGNPVLVGWNQPHPVSAHAALVVGIEGRQNGQTFEPHSLLLLDPAGDAPALAGFNARLDRHGDEGVIYRSSNAARTICLKGAVSMGEIVTEDATAAA
ncbi:hypothetical protein [Burkholderia vietnamiensis]|uniref:hypothetical protein n=1 Tax=Burkholderia vietnamiensis TaxID=60552 RepID=UPI000756625D|nr:hypothetical protein [Burkholderia vietnamiensis]KVR88722.1 hypothetical protein WK27_11310 [Burkholderia vietnamiensis]MCA8073815.1 hypothetical protein [Burkholderia vietnamiensis]